MVAVAKAWGLEPIQCGLCRTSKSVRRKFGCDAPSPTPVFSVPCYACDGDQSASLSCRTCRKRGVHSFDRCPSAVVDSDSTEAVRMYVAAKRFNLLPAAGGFMDQACQFVDAFRLIDSRWQRYETKSSKDKRR